MQLRVLSSYKMQHRAERIGLFEAHYPRAFGAVKQNTFTPAAIGLVELDAAASFLNNLADDPTVKAFTSEHARLFLHVLQTGQFPDQRDNNADVSVHIHEGIGEVQTVRVVKPGLQALEIQYRDNDKARRRAINQLVDWASPDGDTHQTDVSYYDITVAAQEIRRRSQAA